MLAIIEIIDAKLRYQKKTGNKDGLQSSVYKFIIIIRIWKRYSTKALSYYHSDRS